jgi:hypothetical protein
MGYTTDFSGRFELDRPLNEDLAQYLETFSYTRHMCRDVDILKQEFGGQFGFEGKYGQEGEFFAFRDGNFGQNEDVSVLNYNQPPTTQPGLWCQWTPSEDRLAIEWDGGEKFYHYTEWLVYIIENFLAPKGYVLNGEITWQGEDISDHGLLIVKDNVVQESSTKSEA